jgi:ketosteroid isomerase-like protein
MTRQQLIDIAHAHAAAERRGDRAATLATLEDDVLYELQPVRRVLRGIDAARRYYDYFFAEFRPLAIGSHLRGEWVTDEGVGQEYTITVRQPGGPVEQHAVVAILTFGTTALSGERLYASERLLRLMFGPVYESAAPLPAPPPRSA